MLRVKTLEVVNDFPHIEDSVSFPSPLHAIQLEMLEAIPIVMVCWEFWALNFPGEVLLNGL